MINTDPSIKDKLLTHSLKGFLKYYDEVGVVLICMILNQLTQQGVSY